MYPIKRSARKQRRNDYTVDSLRRDIIIETSIDAAFLVHFLLKILEIASFVHLSFRPLPPSFFFSIVTILGFFLRPFEPPC